MTAKRRAKKSSLLASLLCLVSGSFWACRPEPAQGQVRVAELLLDGFASSAQQQAVRTQVWKSVAQHPSLVFARGSGGETLHLAYREPVGVLADKAGGSTAQVRRGALKFWLGGRLPQEPYFEAWVQLDCQRPDAGAVTAGIGQGLASLARQVAWAEQPAAQLANAIARSKVANLPADPVLRQQAKDLQVFVVDELGRRRAAQGLVALADLLDPENDGFVSSHAAVLSRRSIGALVRLGDERAVLPLIASTLHKTPDQIVQVLYPLAALGGRQAEAFLVTLASGHDSDLVRTAAADALAELVARAARSKETLSK